MKRKRALQVVLVVVGLFYSFWGYLLFDALWHSRWLNGHNDVLPMFLSLNPALGPCLLVAVKQPAKHRLMIAYGGVVKPCPWVHDDNPIGAGRSARVLLFCASVPKIIFAALYYGRVFHHPIILVPVRVY